MNKRKVARGIIIKKEKILLIHRNKNNRDYYVLPGGGIEENETPEEAIIRELKEELGLDFCVGENIELQDDLNQGYYFIVKDFSGTLQLGGPELERQNENNIYNLEWISFKKIKELNLVPNEVKELILNMCLNNDKNNNI